MTKAKSWALVAVLAVVIVFVAGWFVALSPQKAHVNKLHAESATAVDANQGLAGQISVLKKQESQIPAEQAQIAAIQNRLPATPALASYIRSISAAATATHVDLVSVAPSVPAQAKLQQAASTPGPAAGSAAAPAVPATAAPSAPAVSNLSAIQVTVSVNGDYYAIQQFLTKLETSPRATVVSTVSLTPGQPLQPQGAGAVTTSLPTWQTIQGQIALTIFESSAPAAIAPAAGAATIPAAAPANSSPNPSASSSTTKS